MTQIIPTAEQQAIIDFITNDTGSLVVNALAGAAKTTTIKLAAQRILGPALAVAFNAKIKRELEETLPPNVTCMTLNALGHRAWAQVLGRKRISVDSGKSYAIISALVKKNKLDLNYDEKIQLCNLVAMAKHSGLVPKECKRFNFTSCVADTEDWWEEACVKCDIPFTAGTIRLAKAMLIQGIEDAYAGEIDFDDQIYMTICFNAPYPKFSLIFVDEAQDLSELNHLQIVRAALPNARVIIVGDHHQAIYAFRGADSDSMAKLAKTFNAKELNLSTTFRCDRSICDLVRAHVPLIKPRENAGPGTVKTLESWNFSTLTPNSAVLCRNNAPLVSLAFKLFREGKHIRFVGKDLGEGLVRVLKRFKADATGSALLPLVRSWAEEEIASATLQSKIRSIEDKLECLEFILSANKTLHNEDIILTIKSIFNSTNGITFATGHKAKGLEFDRVFHLDPWRIPSSHARDSGDARQLEQEENIRYVINTRAKHELYFINYNDLED